MQDIRKTKMPKFDPENEGQCQGGEKRYLRHSTRNVRFQIGEFFRIVAT